jgi:nucleotide-binding universal stress UspA family protein
MFKHILLPTDGSKLSEKSIRQGIRFAKACDAKVTALNVIPRIALRNYEEEVVGQANGYLDFVTKVAKGADVECEVVSALSDRPFKEIIKLAKKRDCDLILMASHGRRGVEGFLLGSETQKVLTHSQIPVLVYR